MIELTLKTIVLVYYTYAATCVTAHIINRVTEWFESSEEGIK